MLARFEMMKNKRYKCTNVFKFEKRDNLFLSAIGVVYLMVTKQPPLGFCKRPHKYL